MQSKSEELGDLTCFQDAALQESLNSRLEEFSLKEEARHRRNERAIAESIGHRTLFFTIYIGVITIGVTLLAPYVELHKKFWQTVGDKISANMIPLIVLVGGSVFLTWLLTSPAFFKGPAFQDNFFYIKDLFAISLLRKKTVAFASSILSVLIVIAVVFLAVHS